MLSASAHPCAATRYYPPTFTIFCSMILVTRDEMQGVFKELCTEFSTIIFC